MGIADVLRSDKSLIILEGNLNLSMWSIDYEKFINIIKLKISRMSFGILLTWPTEVPLMLIDHVLVRSDIDLRNFGVGSDIESDHLPFTFTNFMI